MDVQASSANLDLSSAAAWPQRADGRLVMSVADHERRLCLSGGSGGASMDAVRGALKLAEGASMFARELAAAVAESIELREGHRHMAARPGWACARCGRRWPCPSGRRQLAVDFADNPAALTMLLTIRLAEASVDLGAAALPDLYEWVLGWLPAVPSLHSEER